MPTLRALRVNAGLTQIELAERAGVGLTTIVRLEAGRGKRPYPGTRRKIATALGVTIADVDELRQDNGATHAD